MSRSLSRRLQENYPADADIDDRFEELRGASDFEAALVGSSVVERQLELLLRRSLAKKPTDLIQRLFQQQGPLSTFSGKIDTAFAFDLIVDKVADELHRVREIRNAFAHALVPVNFSTPEVAQSLDKFGLLALMRSLPASDSRQDPALPLPTNAKTFLFLSRLLCYFVGYDNQQVKVPRPSQTSGGELQNASVKTERGTAT